MVDDHDCWKTSSWKTFSWKTSSWYPPFFFQFFFSWIFFLFGINRFNPMKGGSCLSLVFSFFLWSSSLMYVCVLIFLLMQCLVLLETMQPLYKSNYIKIKL